MSKPFFIFIKFFLINIIIFSVFHVLHFRLLKPEIVLSAAIIDAIFIPLLTSAVYCFFYKKELFIIFASYVISVLTAVIYAILVPTMVDRSISVHLLLHLDNASEKMLQIDELSSRLSGSYVLEKRYIDHEQQGSIVIKDNEVHLTTKGEIVAKVFLYNQYILKLKKTY